MLSILFYLCEGDFLRLKKKKLFMLLILTETFLDVCTFIAFLSLHSAFLTTIVFINILCAIT